MGTLMKYNASEKIWEIKKKNHHPLTKIELQNYPFLLTLSEVQKTTNMQISF